VYTGGKHARVHDRRVRTGRDMAVCTGHGRTICARPLHGGVHGPYTVMVIYCVRVRAMKADGCVNEVRPRPKLKPWPRPTPRPKLRLYAAFH